MTIQHPKPLPSLPKVNNAKLVDRGWGYKTKKKTHCMLTAQEGATVWTRTYHMGARGSRNVRYYEYIKDTPKAPKAPKVNKVTHTEVNRKPNGATTFSFTFSE
jgi:hypothetical protein